MDDSVPLRATVLELPLLSNHVLNLQCEPGTARDSGTKKHNGHCPELMKLGV